LLAAPMAYTYARSGLKRLSCLLEICHAIRKTGVLTSANCHAPAGLLDFKALGYHESEIRLLQEPRT